MLKGIDKIENLGDKRVLMRIDINLSVSNGIVLDDYRLRRVIPTILEIHNSGAEIVLMSHFKSREENDFNVVVEHTKKIIPIDYCDSHKKEDVEKAMSESKSKIVLLKNLRADEREKANNDDFAKELSELGDVYINEAFSVSHREHASIVGVPKYLPCYAGNIFLAEIKELSRAFNPPENSLFILGGAKFQTKFPLVEKFKDKYKDIAIVGALANTVLKNKGINIGKSVFDDGDFSLPEKNKGEYQLPIDAVIENHTEKEINDLSDEDKILDAGEKTIDRLKEIILQNDFVLWSGPLGYYEKGFKKGTLDLAKALAESKTQTIIGGGDTVTSIEELGLLDAYDFVSTGGGAMLSFLAEETLPGIEVLKA